MHWLGVLSFSTGIRLLCVSEWFGVAFYFKNWNTNYRKFHKTDHILKQKNVNGFFSSNFIFLHSYIRSECGWNVCNKIFNTPYIQHSHPLYSNDFMKLQLKRSSGERKTENKMNMWQNEKDSKRQKQSKTSSNNHKTI